MSLSQTTPLIFEKFTDEQGLPNNAFRHMIQDRQGLLWMAGVDGLAKYDGFEFTTYRHSHIDSTSISGNNLTRLYEDTKGRLWVSTYWNGVNISNPGKSGFQVVRFPSEEVNPATLVANDITEDALGQFWLATNSGLIILKEKEGKFQQVSLPGSISLCDNLDKTNALFVDAQKRVWIGTQGGLAIYDAQSGIMSCPATMKGLPMIPIQHINADRQGRIWIGCQNDGPRLYYTTLNDLHFTPFDGIPFTSTSRGIQFVFDHDNQLWITEFGAQVCAYDFRDSTLFLQSTVNSNAAHERFLRNPFVDHSGNVWIHCEGYLIYRYPKGFLNYQHPFAFHQSSMCIYGVNDHLWMGYREKGAVRLTISTKETVHFSVENAQYRVPVDHIADFLKVKSGNMIIVGFGNISVMNPQGKIIASHAVNGTNRHVFEDSKGRIWIGGFKGLHLFSETHGVIQTYTLPPRLGEERNFIQTILEDAQGQIWFCSDLHGLGKLNPADGEITQFLPIEGDMHSIPTAGVVDFTIDKDNIFWLATDVALVRYDPAMNVFKSYDSTHGLENDYICSVICDKSGLIWMSTHAGISSFDPATEKVNNYNVKDGLLNNTYYNRNKHQAGDGMIYFGGKNGIDFFYPSGLRSNPTPPVMSLADVIVNNTTHISHSDIDSSSGVIALSHKDNLVQITFKGLYYAAPDDVTHFYRMDGIHDDWVDLGRQNSVLFSNLKPGDYTFRAKATTADGVWSKEELSIPIEVSPPFYGTLWFRILVVCLLISMFIGFVKYRERRIQQKEKQEAEVKSKLIELEKRALQAQMNPHFIYNSMNSIQQFMVVHDFEGAMKYLTRFSRILRTVLNMSSQSRIPLYDEIKLIEDYLELENMRFPNKFSYVIDLSPEINVHTVEIPPFFIQPQVENAIRHGLLKKTEQGHLAVSIDKEDPYLRIVVEDNGIGRAASIAAKHKESVIQESKGLAIVEERLSHLHSQNGIHPFKVTDLYDAENNAVGTKVEIYLPLD